MGRKKIAIKKINDNRRRQVTFVRRKFGLMKKAYELSVLCDCDVALVMITPEDKLYLYSNKHMQDIIIKHNDIVNDAPQDCEILNDSDMVRLIERGKDELDNYFGQNEDDDFEDDEDVCDDTTPKKSRKRLSSSSLQSSSASKKGRLVTVPVADHTQHHHSNIIATSPLSPSIHRQTINNHHNLYNNQLHNSHNSNNNSNSSAADGTLHLSHSQQQSDNSTGKQSTPSSSLVSPLMNSKNPDGSSSATPSNNSSSDQTANATTSLPSYFYGHQAPGYPPNFMPFQPYILYPHPTATSMANTSGVIGGVNGIMGHGHAGGIQGVIGGHGGVANGPGHGGSGEEGMGSGSNSAFHLPPIGPFTFSHQLNGDGSVSSNSLNVNGEGSSLPHSGSAMFAGGIYYPFGAHWQTVGSLHQSNSNGEIRHTSSTIDLITAAEAAASADAHSDSKSNNNNTNDMEMGTTNNLSNNNNIDNNSARGKISRNASDIESVKIKEGNVAEEATKSKSVDKQHQQQQQQSLHKRSSSRTAVMMMKEESEQQQTGGSTI